METIEVKAALDKISDQVREAGEKALAEASAGVKMSTEQKERIDHLLIEQGKLSAQLGELAQKADKAAIGGGAGMQTKTFGEQIVESEQFRAFKSAGSRGSFSIALETKQITSASAGGLIRPQFETELVALERRRLTVRSLIPTVPITTSSVDYPKQLTRVNAAAPVAEGAPKPYSTFTWGNATAPVRTIAHLAKLTRQAMDDAPRLVAEVDSEMRYGLNLVEEAQLLNGDGTGQNLSGLVTQATAYAAPFTPTSPTSIDALRLAMLQAELALYPSDGIILNPSDWARIELTKTAQNEYLFANPQGTVQPRLWGLPVVSTPAMTIDKFLVGGFRVAATIYDRMGIEVLISTENVDDFEKNLATMRAEERLALAVKRPGALIYGDFGLVA